MHQQGLLPDKKREGRCSGDYFPLRHHRDERWCNSRVYVDQVIWCLQLWMNHQGLLWNVHCVLTVVLGKQLNFKSPVIRSTIFLVAEMSSASNIPLVMFFVFLVASQGV